MVPDVNVLTRGWNTPFHAAVVLDFGALVAVGAVSEIRALGDEESWCRLSSLGGAWSEARDNAPPASGRCPVGGLDREQANRTRALEHHDFSPLIPACRRPRPIACEEMSVRKSTSSSVIPSGILWAQRPPSAPGHIRPSRNNQSRNNRTAAAFPQTRLGVCARITSAASARFSPVPDASKLSSNRPFVGSPTLKRQAFKEVARSRARA